MGTILPSTSGAMISSAIGVVGSFIASFFTEIRGNDVSASGASVTIMTKDIESGSAATPVSEPYTIEHFADDKPGFAVGRTKYNETSSSFRGKMMSWKSVPTVTVEISVIPNSKDDVALSNILNWEKNDPDYQVTRDIELVVKVPRVKPDDPKKKSGEYCKITFTSGRICEAPGGGSYCGAGDTASGDGRIEGKTYQFVFNEWTGSTESMPAKSWLQSIGSALIGT